jgi:hypothetical protein
MRELTGGCRCGTVRYELKSEPFDCGWCHCRTCQLVSGAPAMAFAAVKDGDWSLISGGDKIRKVRLSSFAERLFCSECGTPLAIDYDTQPESFDFNVVTLDDPGAVPPEFHIFWSQKVPWFNPDDSLPKHQRFRSETPNIEGTKPDGERG